MINFSPEAEYNYLKNNKIEKKCEKLLESTLRKLGVFIEDMPIEIKNYRSGESYLDTIYSVEDLNNTLFEFYNFSLGKIGDTSERYRKNYQLTMKLKNGSFTYKYDFYETDYLRMIEISFNLTENRVIKLERKLNQLIRLIIEEDSKKYIVGFYDNQEDHDKLLLEDFDNMVEKALDIDKLNLENVLKIIKNQKKINFAHVSKDNQIIASVDFNEGEISRYKIEELDKKVEVTLSNKITRTTEKMGTNKIIKNNTEIKDSYEIITLDYKRLFKQL